MIYPFRSMRRGPPRGLAALIVSGLAAGGLALPSVAGAQTGLASGGGRSFGVGAAYETYRFASPLAANLESLSLVSAPFTARAPILSRAVVEVRGAFARGEIREADGTSTTISGLVDTEISLGVGFTAGPATANIDALVVAPTGIESLDDSEARVAALIASELLPFRFTNWGMGGAAGLAVNLARPVGSGNVGFGVGYLAAREFEPVRDAQSFTYRPGNRLQVRLAADRNVANAGKLSLSLAFERHEEDRAAGVNLYRPGNRYQGMASYAFTTGGRSTGIVYAGGLHSADGVSFQPTASDFSSRTLLLAGGGMRIPLGTMVVMPSIDGRVFRRGSGSGQGYLTGVGATLEAPAGAVVIAPTARLRLGNLLVRDGAESRVTGIDVGVTIRGAR